MARLLAVKILVKLIDENKSLSQLKSELTKVDPKDRPFTQELCFGVARWFYRLTFIVDQLLKKPLKEKDSDIYVLLLVGVYQLLYTRVPDHAAISETVNVARGLKKEWATGLINAILRAFVKNKDKLLASISKNPEALYAHPEWFIEKVKKAWPSWESILEANNQHPPLCIRVNIQKISRDDYLAKLKEHNIECDIIPWTLSGIRLQKAVDISALPHFSEGFVSIQDGSAQLAAELLDAQSGEKVLDACAAPGGKTGHILERQPKLKELIALDNDANRLKKVEENLQRLGFTATIICHDILDLGWWNGEVFDRILLDVPCSSTGVINRHPDIKLLREETDIPNLAKTQYEALETIWKTLKNEGTLLYVTCSIFPEENELIVKKFLNAHDDCIEEEINADWGLKVSVGKQILPGMYPGMDGFYFAKLRRKAKE